MQYQKGISKWKELSKFGNGANSRWSLQLISHASFAFFGHVVRCPLHKPPLDFPSTLRCKHCFPATITCAHIPEAKWITANLVLYVLLLIVLLLYLTLNSATAAETRAQEGKAEANPNPNRKPNPNFTSSSSAGVYEKFMGNLIVDPRSSVYTMASRNAAGSVLSPSAGLSVTQAG